MAFGLAALLIGREAAYSVLLGYLLSLFNIVVSYFTIRRSFGRSTKRFFAALYAGMVVRFLVFLLALFLIYKLTPIPVIGFVIAFMIFYIILQYYEIKTVNRELEGPQR